VVGLAGTLVAARLGAGRCLLALAVVLASCGDPASHGPAPAETFAAAYQRALASQTAEDIGRAVDRFEQLGSAATDTDIAMLGDLARRSEQAAPIEAIRTRLLLAAQPIGQTELASATALALAEAGLVHAAQSAASQAATRAAAAASSAEGSEGQALSDRLQARDSLAARLRISVGTPAAKRLLDILTQSPYDDPDERIWIAAIEAEAANNTDPARICRIAQFSGPQLLGRQAETDRRYRHQSATLDTTRRPLLGAAHQEEAAFNVLSLEHVQRLAPAPLCTGGADDARPLAPILKRAGVHGTVVQQLCIGKSAAAVVQDDLAHRVILLLSTVDGLDVLQSIELDPSQLRRLRGPSGQPVLLVSTVGGARGYLTAAVLDLASRQQLLAASMLMFGEVNALPLGTLETDSLWFRFAVAQGRENCGQCPRHRKVIHVDSVGGGYRVAGDLCSAQEVYSATSGFMSANAVVSVLSGDDEIGIGISDYGRFVDRQRRAGRSPEEFVPQMVQHFVELADYMKRASDFVGLERRALDLESALATVPPFEPALLSAAARAAARTAQMEAAYFRGDLDRAIEIGERSIRETYSVEVPRIQLDFANRLSTVYLAQQNYRAAYPNLELSLALDTEGAPAVPGNLAWYSIQASDFRSAERYAMRAMHAAVKKDGRLGINAVFMAVARARTGRSTDGLDWLVFANRVAASSGDSPDQALALMSAARMALDAGEPRLGLSLLEQSMIFMDETIWTTEGPGYLQLQARLLLRLGDKAGAQLLAQMAENLSRGRPTTARVEALLLLSRLAADAGDAPAALALARDAFQASVEVATNWQGEGYQLASAETAREAAEWYLTMLSRDPTMSADAVFDALARWKAHVLRDGLARRQGAGPAGATTDAAAAAALLATNEAYVDYFIGEQAAFALVLHGGRMRLVPLSETAATVRVLVRDVLSEMDVTQSTVRDRIGRHRVSASLDSALRRLHSVLLAPIGLPADVRRLYVASDSAVSALPWAALIDPAGRYLGERVAVLAVPGASFLPPLPDCTGERCTARTLVAGVGRTQSTSATADDGSPVTLLSLRYGREELKQLSALWGERWLELSDRNGPAQPQPQGEVLPWLAQHATRIKALHVVGHGTFSRSDPVTSRLYIEPSSAPPFVTAAQLSTLDYAGLPLVMIGACESGALRGQGGGEPLGLVRAFLSGGVERVIASNWLVDDRATLMLTTKLHESLRQSVPIGEAFFAAQRETARRYPHPYFWAAFQMHGRPER